MPVNPCALHCGRWEGSVSGLTLSTHSMAPAAPQGWSKPTCRQAGPCCSPWSMSVYTRGCTQRSRRSPNLFGLRPLGTAVQHCKRCWWTPIRVQQTFEVAAHNATTTPAGALMPAKKTSAQDACKALKSYVTCRPCVGCAKTTDLIPATRCPCPLVVRFKFRSCIWSDWSDAMTKKAPNGRALCAFRYTHQSSCWGSHLQCMQSAVAVNAHAPIGRLVLGASEKNCS